MDSYIEFESEQSVGQKAGDIWNQQQPVCLYIESMQEPGNNERMHFHEIYRNPSNISRALTQLEEKGYMTKEPSREDRRTCHLYPTKKAQETYEQIEEILSGCDQEIMEIFSEEEKEIFPGILQKAALRAVELNEKERK